MTNTVDTVHAPNLPAAAVAPGADNIGQATAVEQARAVAEVQGAIVVAQRVPRSIAKAIERMQETCSQKGLAQRAFFRYSRGGSQITGASVHLARELARCWGNMQYGLVELSRDDAKGESQMLAFAWDVETNTRATTTFIVKHGRDTKDGIKALTDLRDVYENNANMGARRLREQVFAILPKWFTEDAQDRCRTTIASEDSGKTLPQRIADMVETFAKIGVTVDQLEGKIGRPRDKWIVQDVVALWVVGRSIQNGEATVEQEFPESRVTADELLRDEPATEPETKTRSNRGRPSATPAEPDQAVIDELNREAAEQEAEREKATAGTGSALFTE